MVLLVLHAIEQQLYFADIIYIVVIDMATLPWEYICIGILLSC